MNHNRGPLEFLFYPFIILILIGGIYFIYQNNPSLMDQLSLLEKQKNSKKSEVFVSKSPLAEKTELWEAESTKILNLQNDKSHPRNHRVDHRYDAFTEGPKLPDGASWTLDKQGFIIHHNNEVHLYNLEGDREWSFISQQELCTGQIHGNSQWIPICYKNGGLILLSREDGQLIWYRKDKNTYLQNPFFIEDKIFVISETANSKRLYMIDAQTGEERAATESLPKDFHMPLTISGKKVLVTEKSGSIYAYSLNTMKPIWKSDLVADFVAAVATSGNKIFATASEGQVYALSLSKGSQVWEYNLKRNASRSMTIARGLGIGSIIDDEGYLHMMDTERGKRKWRFNTQTESSNKSMMAVRLFNDNANRLNMGAESQGWLFWGPCRNRQICAFEPFKGLLVRRIDPENGKILHLPIYSHEQQKMALLVEQSGEKVFKIYADRDWLKAQKEDAEATNPGQLPNN